jgi:hypothetical protein
VESSASSGRGVIARTTVVSSGSLCIYRATMGTTQHFDQGSSKAHPRKCLALKSTGVNGFVLKRSVFRITRALDPSLYAFLSWLKYIATIFGIRYSRSHLHKCRQVDQLMAALWRSPSSHPVALNYRVFLMGAVQYNRGVNISEARYVL